MAYLKTRKQIVRALITFIAFATAAISSGLYADHFEPIDTLLTSR
jgi:hypothetical protein